jgi:RNA polymerase sigma-70 factor (ECF subfamily)
MSSAAAHSTLSSLLHRHKAGDEAAGNALLTHCHERFKQLTRQMLRKFPGVREWEETSDVFHNVVVRLTAALREITPDNPADFLRLASWHIRRELIDLSRRRRPVLAGGPAGGDSGPDPIGGQPDTTDDPYRLAVWEELHTRIARLSDDDRRLFDLIYYQGLPQPEVAELLGLPLRTLKLAWQHARARLMLSLGNEVPF